MYKTKSSDNDCYNDAVITIPELDNNSIKTTSCSFTQIFCIGGIAFCAVAGMYIFINNLYNNTYTEESSMLDMDIMGDMPSYLP